MATIALGSTGKRVEFPDDMNQGEMLHHLRKNFMKVYEPAATIVTGALAEPLAGLASLPALIYGDGVQDAVKAQESVREWLTYVPKTQEGMQGMKAVADVLMPVADAFEWTSRTAGDYVYENTGNPELAAIAYSMPTASLELLGLKGTRAASKAGHLGKQYELGDIGTSNKQAGMFAGMNATGADANALSKAKEMQKAGSDKLDIWNKTGFYMDYDGKWKWEIDDSMSEIVFPDLSQSENVLHLEKIIAKRNEMRDLYREKGAEALPDEFKQEVELVNGFKIDDLPPDQVEALFDQDIAFFEKQKELSMDFKNTNFKAGEVLKHDELFKNYPELQDVSVRFIDNYNDPLGAYNSLDDRVTINLNKKRHQDLANDPNIDETQYSPANILLHELQHKIQYREGFAKGGNNSTPGMLESQGFLDVATKDVPADRMDDIFEGDYAYKKALNESYIYSRADYLSKLDKIKSNPNPRPSLITGTTDWYRYHYDIDNYVGYPMPKRKGEKRTNYMHKAAEFLVMKNLEKIGLEKGFGMRNRIADLAIADDAERIIRNGLARTNRAMNKNFDAADSVRKHNDTLNRFEGMERPLFGGKDRQKQYWHIGGEVEARRTPFRHNLTSLERRERFPLADDYDLEVDPENIIYHGMKP